MEEKEKKPPLERQEFKLLTESERKFADNPTAFIKIYKPESQDAMARQYNNRIKYRAINAIKEIAWLCDKLPEEQLQKIFTNERMKDLFDIVEKTIKFYNSDKIIEHVLHLLKSVVPEEHYYRIMERAIHDPEFFQTTQNEASYAILRTESLNSRIAVLEKILAEYGLEGIELQEKIKEIILGREETTNIE